MTLYCVSCHPEGRRRISLSMPKRDSSAQTLQNDTPKRWIRTNVPPLYHTSRQTQMLLCHLAHTANTTGSTIGRRPVLAKMSSASASLIFVPTAAVGPAWRIVSNTRNLAIWINSSESWT